MSKNLYDAPWRNVRRYGVGMVADLIRKLVDRAKAKEPTYNFTQIEKASLSVRIYAAGGKGGSTFAWSSHAIPADPWVAAVALFAHDYRLRALLRKPTARTVSDCLAQAANLKVDSDLISVEARWRILDLTDGKGLPENHRLAFEAAWIAKNHEFVIKQLLRPFLKSPEGRTWMKSTSLVSLDEPVAQLAAARAALVRRSNPSFEWAMKAARDVDQAISLIEAGKRTRTAIEVLRRVARTLRAEEKP